MTINGSHTKYLTPSRRLLYGSLLALFVIHNPSLEASIGKRLSLEALITQSQNIVSGTVTDHHSYRTEGGKYVLTDVTIQVEQSLKGAAKGSITVTLMGGTVDGITTTVIGSPQFCGSERVVLFLTPIVEQSPMRSYRYALIGLSQGKFEFINSESIRSAAVNADLSLLPDGSGASLPPGGKEGLPLQQLIRMITDDQRREVESQ